MFIYCLLFSTHESVPKKVYCNEKLCVPLQISHAVQMLPVFVHFEYDRFLCCSDLSCISSSSANHQPQNIVSPAPATISVDTTSDILLFYSGSHMFSHSCVCAALYSDESFIGSVAKPIKWRSANYQILWSQATRLPDKQIREVTYRLDANMRIRTGRTLDLQWQTLLSFSCTGKRICPTLLCPVTGV